MDDRQANEPMTYVSVKCPACARVHLVDRLIRERFAGGACDPPRAPSFLRRTVGITWLHVIGIPMVVVGMLLMLPIVAYDTVERRFKPKNRP